MRNRKSNLVCEETPYIKFAAMSVLGDREEQEDCFGYDMKENKAIITVCDGMGGHRGGKLASNTAVTYILDAYKNYFNNTQDCDNKKRLEKQNAEGYMRFLHNITVGADCLISSLTDENGNLLQAGATMVTVIMDGTSLFWSSVGDSRLYLLRNTEFIQVTVDHNYHGYLKEQLMNNEISREEYVKENQKGEALLCYLGVNGLQLIHHNIEPFPLMRGDTIIIMSDGLYKILSNEEIARELLNCKELNETAHRLDRKAAEKARKNKIDRDNMTVALIRLK